MPPRNPPAAHKWPKQLTVLRLGFATMIGLLLFSALEAYRIQDAASRQTADIYHHYAKTGETLWQIRRVVLLGSIDARDYFLSGQPDRATRFREQINALKSEAGAALDALDLATRPEPPSTELRTNLREYWATLESTLGWSDAQIAARGFDFVQSEVVPRRNAAGASLRHLAEANQEALQHSDAEFARSRRNTMWRLFVMLGLSIVLGMAVAHFSLIHAARLERQSVRRFEEVAQAKWDLEQLSARLLEVQEDERRRLSRELHDEIGQTLTALRIEISHAQAAWKTGSPAVQARLEQARSLAEKTVSGVRDISLLLRPSLLDDLGLGPALQWQAEDFSRRTGIRCSFSEDGLQEALPDAHKTCVYRVVQEALNNCLKHSAATAVRLSVSQKEDTLHVRIEDNGRGFALDDHGAPAGATGLGILGMKERVAALRGTLKLASAPDKGAIVSIQIPLPPPRDGVRSGQDPTEA